MIADSRPLIYLITKGEATDDNFDLARDSILEAVNNAIVHNVGLIQIREKGLSARRLCELTGAVVDLTHGSSTRVLVNDRADIALACGADGVHLSSISVPAAAVRASFAEGFIIGVSTHSLGAAESARNQGADFAVFGPVFETPGKGKAKGLDDLRRVCDGLFPFPIVGLGGIDQSNFRSVVDAGAVGVAAIRSLNDRTSLTAIANGMSNDRS